MLVLLWGATAWANGAEELLGVGSRVKAMGGAGTGLARDSSATYYNPASLAFCANNELSVGVAHLGYDLEARRTGQAGGPEPEPLEDRPSASLGVCLLLPLDFAFGLYFGIGLDNPQHLNQASVNARPIFAMYGRRLESMSLMFGPAYRVLDELSVGVALSVLAHSNLFVQTEVPLATPDAEVDSSLQWRLDPTVALYAGVSYSPSPELLVGLSYRGALFHKLEAVAPTQVELGGVLVGLDLLLESVAWYSPQQAALGASFSPVPEVTVAGDVTWYDWSEYPGPYVHPSPASDSAIGRTLLYPETEPAGFEDVLVPRLGLELDWEQTWKGIILTGSMTGR